MDARRTALAHPARRGLIAALVVFSLLTGGGVAYAAWTSSATATSTASVATLALTTANFTTNQYTFANDLLITTGSVTVTNTTTTTSSTVPALSLAFDTSAGDPLLAAAVHLSVWPSSLGACTAATATPGAASTGTWASFTPIVTTLAKTASVTYCVRSYGAERGDLGNAAGTTSITPRVTATLSVANFTGVASATATQNTQYIYPVFTPDEYTWYNIRTTESPVRCVRSGGTGNGSAVREATCSTNTNRQWLFSNAGGSYYDIQPANATGLRIDSNASTTSGAAVTVRTNNDALAGQQWQLQEVSAGVYQFVNNLSGLCLETAATSAAQVTCNATAAQSYTLSVVSVIPHIDSIGCTNTGTTGTSRRVQYSWSPAASQTYSLQYRSTTSTGNWTQVATIASGNSTYLWATGTSTPNTNGTWNVRVIAGTSTSAATAALATSTVLRASDGAGVYLRCN
jgi:hypothetical protein